MKCPECERDTLSVSSDMVYRIRVACGNADCLFRYFQGGYENSAPFVLGLWGNAMVEGYGVIWDEEPL